MAQGWGRPRAPRGSGRSRRSRSPAILSRRFDPVGGAELHAPPIRGWARQGQGVGGGGRRGALPRPRGGAEGGDGGAAGGEKAGGRVEGQGVSGSATPQGLRFAVLTSPARGYNRSEFLGAGANLRGVILRRSANNKITGTDSRFLLEEWPTREEKARDDQKENRDGRDLTCTSPSVSPSWDFDG